MTVEIAAIGLTLLVHVIGAGVLIWALLDGDGVDWRTLWPRDDDGGGGPPEAPHQPVGGGGDVVPVLPAAAPSPVRLREPGRIADAHPRPPRRTPHPVERPAPRVPERG